MRQQPMVSSETKDKIPLKVGPLHILWWFEIPFREVEVVQMATPVSDGLGSTDRRCFHRCLADRIHKLYFSCTAVAS